MQPRDEACVTLSPLLSASAYNEGRRKPLNGKRSCRPLLPSLRSWKIVALPRVIYSPISKASLACSGPVLFLFAAAVSRGLSSCSSRFISRCDVWFGGSHNFQSRPRTRREWAENRSDVFWDAVARPSHGMGYDSRN